MKEQFKNYMQTFNVHHIYRGLRADGMPKALDYWKQALEAQNQDTEYIDNPIRLQTVEDLIYGLSDPYMSTVYDYTQVYDTPLSKATFNKLVILKCLASVCRRQQSNLIQNQILDALFPGLTSTKLAQMFKDSAYVKITPTEAMVQVDLGPYYRIDIEGPGCIKYQVSDQIIDNAYRVIDSLSPIVATNLDDLAEQLQSTPEPIQTPLPTPPATPLPEEYASLLDDLM